MRSQKSDLSLAETEGNTSHKLNWAYNIKYLVIQLVLSQKAISLSTIRGFLF